MSQTMEQTEIGSLSDAPDKKPKSRRPANTAFRQQRLKAWQPILTPKTVLPLFFAIGIIFAPIGGALLYASSKVQEIIIDYSDCNTTAPACPTMSDIPGGKITANFKSNTARMQPSTWCRNVTDVPIGTGNRTIPEPTCHVQFDIPTTLQAPVFFYYQLTNFYQNHRRYVKSFDQDQLDGKNRTGKQIKGSDCSPLTTNADGKPYYPCGLIANSLFNDTFFSPVLLNSAGNSGSNQTYNMTNKGIAWPSDAALYKNTSYAFSDVVPPVNWVKRYPDGYNDEFPFPELHTLEEFQVWMRTAGLPTFSKLALRNDDENMVPGRYQVDVHDNFPVKIYNGKKSILISTRTVMGGKNPFLGIAYIVGGGLCILLGALFTVTQFVKPRKLGDHSYLSWNTDQPSTATTTGRASRPGDAA